MLLRDRLKTGVRGPSDSRRPSGTKIGMLLVIVVVLLAIGVFLYRMGESGRVATDANTLCPTDRPPSEVVVLLLDMSDEFSEPQLLHIKNELDRLWDHIGRFGLVEAYRVDRLQQRVTSPVIHVCNPGTGSDLNALYQNPALARKQWEAVTTRLKDELSAMMTGQASETSAIFEAVQATALRTFNRPDYDGLPKRLVIVSDLLQNVPGKMSQYHGTPPFEEFRRSAYFSEVRADLSHVEVTLLYLVRPRVPQKWPEHYRFWEQYFVAQGATLETVEPIYGAQ